MEILKEILFGSGNVIYSIAPLVISLISMVASELLSDDPEEPISFGNNTGNQMGMYNVSQQQGSSVDASTIGSILSLFGGSSNNNSVPSIQNNVQTPTLGSYNKPGIGQLK